MTEPIRVPGDGVKMVKSFLIDNAALFDDDVTFALNVPSDWQPGLSPPHVGIFDDGGGTEWPIVTRPTIRITAWSDGRDRSRGVVGLCMGIILGRTIPGMTFSREPSAILDALDSHNGGRMASFFVRATVRTVAV